MREVVIVSSVRTPVGRAFKGTLRATRPDELAAIAIKGALERVPQLDPKEIEDVILGCAMPEAEQGMNVARIASLRAGLPVEVSAMTINRFCSSGLAGDCHGGRADHGGRRGNHRRRRNRIDDHDSHGRPQGLAQPVAGRSLSRRVSLDGTDRRTAGEALRHHARAGGRILVAQPSESACGDRRPASSTTKLCLCRSASPRRTARKPKRSEIVFKMDEGPRADTSLEALLALKPAFHVKGTVTAGNSSQMSDGAAAAVVMSAERAKALGLSLWHAMSLLPPRGTSRKKWDSARCSRFRKRLKMAGLKLDDIDVIELNEAFAAQSLAVIQGRRLDPERVNPNGGAIALGIRWDAPAPS